MLIHSTHKGANSSFDYLYGITRYKNIDIQTILYLQVKIGQLDKNYDFYDLYKFTYYYKHETQQEWNCSKNVQFYT
jgi:hypothetical protein